MYLIFQFSQLVDLSIQITDVAGVSHRIAQLIERLGILDVFWKDVFPGKDLDSDYSEFSRYPRNKQVEESGDGENKIIPAWSLQKVSYSAPFRAEPLASCKNIIIEVTFASLI